MTSVLFSSVSLYRDGDDARGLREGLSKMWSTCTGGKGLESLVVVRERGSY